MCGRFTLYSPLEEVYERFHIEGNMEFQFSPRYNIAPSQQVVAVVNDGERNRIGYLKWGLVPSWAKEASIGNKMINARAESLAEKPSFREAYLKRRCLIITDGFYEWKKEDGHKIPVYIHVKDKQPFAFAGLWERWISPKGEEITSCTIITTEANSFMAPIHHRMPVILLPDKEKIWLDRSISDRHILDELLLPYPDTGLSAYPVSTLVNTPKHDEASLIHPV